MRKRIFSNMLILIIVSLFACSVALCAVFYTQLSSSVQREVRERAILLRETIVYDNYEALAATDMRITIVAPDGTVLHDDDHNAAFLSNHAEREEIIEALDLGEGESRRFSDTLGQETYYYAIRLHDGSVLRLAKTMSSIWGMFGEIIPIVSLIVITMLIAGYFLAGSLTKRIVNPINTVNMEGTLTAPYDELAPFVQTISQQRQRISQQIEDLQNRANTISAILDSMSEGVILVDKQGIILSVNNSAADIFTLNQTGIGKNILEIIRDIEINEGISAALKNARVEMNFSHNDKIYRVYFSPVIDSGAIILFLDVTESSLTEKLRREFSANVSHELKTPLTTIYGNVEMLESNMVKETDIDEFYGKIKDEAARLITLIEDIIMLSQLDENNSNILMEEVDLSAAALAAVQSLGVEAKKQDIEVSVSGKGTLYANYSQIVELFYNLIENAIKYNKQDGAGASGRGGQGNSRGHGRRPHQFRVEAGNIRRTGHGCFICGHSKRGCVARGNGCNLGRAFSGTGQGRR